MATAARPLTQEDFAPRKPQEKGDKTADEVYRSVGLALTHWAMGEQRLNHIFALLMKSNIELASFTLSTIVSIPTKRDLIMAAAKVTLQDKPPLVKKIGAKLEVFSAASARRNEIAHGCIRQHFLNRVDQGHFWESLSYNAKRTRSLSGAGYRYIASDITAFAMMFERLKFEFEPLLDEVRANV